MSEPPKKELSNHKQKLRIFLSYGHDSNSELVERIKYDLETRGHDVWFDRNPEKEKGITPGDDWREAITKGIIRSNLMLSFLSKHSTRDPGVCLDELSIALGTNSGIVQTILVEAEKEVLAPVSVSHLQWLDMHDWKDNWDSESKSPLPNGWYEEKLAQIIRVIESDNSYRFSGEIEELKNRLLPVTSDVRIGWLLEQGFEGRTWLAQEINEWRLENTDSRVFFLTGKPGVGKSAFAAWLAHQNKSNIIAAHFIEYNKPDRKDPRRIITSIAFQIATRLPDYRKLLMGLPELDRLGEKSATELFSCLLMEPLRHAIEGGRERYAVIIDALDEASDDPNNSIVDIIAQETEKLPKWITFIITSRPNPDIMRRLSGLSPVELAADDDRNRQDLSEFLRDWIERRRITLKNPEKAINGIVAASEGNFLYLRKFCEWVKDKGWIDLSDSKTYPKGMTGMYQLYFRRQFPNIDTYEKYQVPLLDLIVASFEPLPEILAEQALGWKGRERVKVLDPLGSLFQRQDGRISPFHKSLRDWLVTPDDAGDYYIPIDDGHRKMARAFIAWLQSEDRIKYTWKQNKSDIINYWAQWGLDYLALSHQALPEKLSPYSFLSVVENTYRGITFHGLGTNWRKDGRSIFTDKYVFQLIENKNEETLLRLLRIIKEVALIEYIKAGVLREKYPEEDSNIHVGDKSYRTKGSATDGQFIDKAFKASACAGSMALTIFESIDKIDPSFESSIIKEIKLLAYLAEGFEMVGWADHISLRYSDYGKWLSDALVEVINKPATHRRTEVLRNLL